ncbi:hypothetical protein L195_g002491 [Trifolium pratense]|uniref:Uncharacterized protein n=1 Tax=Trifolium pratense TaxID=57577 RepID=A0A2K3NSL5_TRIPR|nr:hypothetical protein L195_g002491 [Trifolium pratense]
MVPNLWSVCDQFGKLCSIPSPRLEAIDCRFSLLQMLSMLMHEVGSLAGELGDMEGVNGASGAVNRRIVKRRFKAWGMGQAMQSSQGGAGGLSN